MKPRKGRPPGAIPYTKPPGAIPRSQVPRPGPVQLPPVSPETQRLIAENRPLRRPAGQPPEPGRVFWFVTPAIIDEGFAAADRGEGTALPTPEGQLPVWLSPSAQEAIEKSGPPELVQRVHTRLVRDLGNPDTMAQKRPWSKYPTGSLHQVLLSGRECIHVFTFVVGLREGRVVVAAGEHYRHRL